MLPFTREQFLAVFVGYNEAVWPAQVLAYLMGLLMAALVIRPSPRRSRVVATGLAAMWLWTGVVYHGMNFSTISYGAWGFAALFVAQGLLFLEAGALRRRLALVRAGTGPAGWAGAWWPMLALGIRCWAMCSGTAIQRCRCSALHPVPSRSSRSGCSC